MGAVCFDGDVLVVGGEIAAARRVVAGVSGGCVVIDAGGLVGCAGFKEIIAAGAWGGFATRCCRPNADPPIDSALAYGGRSVTEEQVTAGGGDFVGDVLVAGGEIVAARRLVAGVSGGGVVVDAGGLVGCPGFNETIVAGARGGFTALCGRPNVEPPIDSGSLNDGIEIGSALAHGGRMTVLYQLNASEGA